MLHPTSPTFLPCGENLTSTHKNIITFYRQIVVLILFILTNLWDLSQGNYRNYRVFLADKLTVRPISSCVSGRYIRAAFGYAFTFCKLFWGHRPFVL